MPENELKIYCNYDSENKMYWANVTRNDFTCGTGYANTEETAIASACSDAFPYIKTKFNSTVLFELCLHWKKGVKEIKV